MPLKRVKNFQFKIYDPTGATFLEELSPDEVISDPSFSTRINAGQGAMALTVARKFDDFGANITGGNLVRVTQFDEFNANGRLIYTGIISKFTPFWTPRGEGVTITLLGLGSIAAFGFYKNGSVFSVAHSADDPKVIAEAIIDHLQTVYTDTAIDYADFTVDLVGVSLTITFVQKTWLQALAQLLLACDPGWYFRIDGDGFFYLREKSSTADHVFTIGRDIDSFSSEKNNETVVNKITVQYTTGGSTVTAEDLASQALYGVRERYFIDTEMKNAATAQQVADKVIADAGSELVTTQLQINSKFDIESIKPGDTCNIRNFKDPTGSDESPFNDNMQIVSIAYKVDTAVLELERIRRDFGIEMQEYVDRR